MTLNATLAQTENQFSEPIKGLIKYVQGIAADSRKPDYPLAAFEHEEKWYFRPSLGLGEHILQVVVKTGNVEDAGTYQSLRKKGIISLHLSEGNKPTNGKTKFYRVKNKKINDAISNPQIK